MRYPTKTAIILRHDLAAWQSANVAAFLAGGLAGRYPDIVGVPYADRDGTAYTALIREPVFVFGADATELQRSRKRALSRGLDIAVYTHDLFATGNDDDNRAAVAAVAGEDLDLVGLGLHGERKIVDKVTGGLKFLTT